MSFLVWMGDLFYVLVYIDFFLFVMVLYEEDECVAWRLLKIYFVIVFYCVALLVIVSVCFYVVYLCFHLFRMKICDILYYFYFYVSFCMLVCIFVLLLIIIIMYFENICTLYVYLCGFCLCVLLCLINVYVFFSAFRLVEFCLFVSGKCLVLLYDFGCMCVCDLSVYVCIWLCFYVLLCVYVILFVC